MILRKIGYAKAVKKMYSTQKHICVKKEKDYFIWNIMFKQNLFFSIIFSIFYCNSAVSFNTFIIATTFELLLVI